MKRVCFLTDKKSGSVNSFESKAITTVGVLRSLQKQIDTGKFLAKELLTPNVRYELQILNRSVSETIAVVCWTGNSLVWVK